jgi:HAD superfamily hydrolase (TIGR01490 family)
MKVEANHTALALFDFDGTLTKQDTMFAFIRFAKGNAVFFLGMILLLPFLVLYKIHLIPNHVAKRWLLAFFFRNKSYEQLVDEGKSFCEKKLPIILRQNGLEKIKWHQQQNHRVIIVSASWQEWIKPWTDSHNIELICTIPEVKNQKLTGNFSTPNCNGQEKVNRIKQHVDLSLYKEIFAYGDTKGDLPMLSLATQSFYKPFHKNK